MIIAAMISAAAENSATVDSLARELKEVVVTANQPATKLEGTTLVSTITGTALQNIGTAIDVLRQLPMITVADDEVSVIGKGTPEILIDGRPLRDKYELLQLLSTNIKKVELDMAPDALYTGTTGAVLRIITRHNFIRGLSLTDRASIKKKRMLTGYEMLDFSYRTSLWEVFASGAVAHNNSVVKGRTVNTLDYQGKPAEIGSTQYNSHPSTNGAMKGGINYSAGSRSFGAYYRYNPERGSFAYNLGEWMDDEPMAALLKARKIRAGSHHCSAYYDDTFCQKYQLHFDGDFHRSHSDTDESSVYPGGESSDVYSADRRTSTLWAGKLYLQFPLVDGQFTIGTQDSYTRTTLDHHMLSEEISAYLPSVLTDTRQTSLAAFASWKRDFGKFSLSAGLRYEYIDYNLTTDGKKDDEVSRRDNLLTPDISLGYTFNDQAQLSLSYKMVTVKPPYSQLTSSLSYAGMHQIEGGNPKLHDEHMHDIKLFGMWNDFMLQADYTRSLDSYAFVRKVYPASTLQLIMQPVNIDVSSLDIYLAWNKSVGAWMPSLTFGMHKDWFDIAGERFGRPLFWYYLNNTITLPRNFIITADINGRSSGYEHTNCFVASWFTFDLSVSKSFLSNQLQLKLSATDIFNTTKDDWSMHTYGINVDRQVNFDTRGVELAVTYRFQPRKSAYKGQSAAEAELNRL